jgi:GDPmannose 4,6-dehydratase
VERSFINPLETFQSNAVGTTNLLEAIRIKERFHPKFIFAGSSEEYGLVVSSREQANLYLEKYGRIFPYPRKIPELPIEESNPLRPMSPYAVTKVYGEYITLNFQRSYGLQSLVTRSFNHEGARRGVTFVTSTIARQVARIKFGEADRIKLGNVNAFRDWSHVDDITEGYVLAATQGEKGEVYNLGSERTNSVLTFVLWALEEAGYHVLGLQKKNGGRVINSPGDEIDLKEYGKVFRGSMIDELLLKGEIEFSPHDEGIEITTNKGTIHLEFDHLRFRPSDIPLLLSDTTKAKRALGFSAKRSLREIITDQLNYYLPPERRGEQ